MISAYKIGVELAMTGGIGRVLTGLIKQFETLNAAIKKVQSSVAALQASMEGLGSSGVAAAKAWQQTAAAMQQAARAGATRGGRAAAASAAAGGGSGGLPAVIGGAAGGAMMAGARTGLGAAFGGGAGGGGGGAIRLPPPGGGGGGGIPLAPLGAGAAGAAAAALGGAGISSHQYGLAAAGFGMAGYGILHGERKAIDAAAEISHLRTALLTQGVPIGAADEMVERSRSIARSTPALTYADVLSAGIDLKSVLGGTEEDPVSTKPALAALPAFAQTMSILNAIGKKRGDLAFASAKSQELFGHLIDERTGGVSAEELQKNLDAANQVAIATKMRVSPTDYLATAKQARIAGISLNYEGLYRTMPALIMEMGGNRAGTGLAAFGRQFMGGTMTQNKFEALQKLGIFDKSATWKHAQVRDVEKHLKQSELAYTNPSVWIWEVLKPALEKAGIVDRIAQARFVAKLASTAVGGGFIASNLTQEVSIQKEARNIAGSQTGAKALETIYSSDFTAQFSNFQAAFHNFLTDVGGPLLEPASWLLRQLTTALNAMGQFAHNNPDIAHNIGVLAGGFGLFAVGSAALSGLMFFGPPMVKVASAFAGFAAGMPGAAGLGAILMFITRLSGIAGFLYGMKPSETNKGEAEFLQKYKEMSPEERSNAMDPAQWYKDHPDVAQPGGPASGTAPLGTAKNPVHTVTHVTNGRDIARGTSNYLADQASKPMSGGNAPDLRMSPMMPGLSGNYAVP